MVNHFPWSGYTAINIAQDAVSHLCSYAALLILCLCVMFTRFFLSIASIQPVISHITLGWSCFLNSGLRTCCWISEGSFWPVLSPWLVNGSSSVECINCVVSWSTHTQFTVCCRCCETALLAYSKWWMKLLNRSYTDLYSITAIPTTAVWALLSHCFYQCYNSHM